MHKLNILNLSTDCDSGAGLAAKEFNRFLLYSGHNSVLVVKESEYPDSKEIIALGKTKKAIYSPKIFVKSLFLKIKYKLSRIKVGPLDSKYSFFNIDESKSDYSAKEILNSVPFKPDVIFIHWVSWFINSKVITELQQETSARLICLMMDNAHLTGGCHYPWECEGFVDDCKNCPAIIVASKKDIARQNMQIKKNNLPDSLELIACSQPDYVKATRSSLFYRKKIHKLTLPVDETLFSPNKNKELLKVQLGVPNNTEKIILFGAISINEKRKGIEYLLKALNKLKEFLTPNERTQVHLLIMGKEIKIKDLEIPFNYTFLGYISFINLKKAFQIADVFVSPSIEDSGPIMVNQSLMCGTPVVSFDVGVAMDLVLNNITGYRVLKEDSDKLASALYNLLFKNSLEHNKMKENCRRLAYEKFSFNSSRSVINSILYENSTLAETMGH